MTYRRPRQKAVKNANRRLDDRLWDENGVEYERVIDGDRGYYARPHDVRAVVLGDAPHRTGLLRDHSFIEWPSGKEADDLTRRTAADGSVAVDGRVFSPTLWRQRNGETIVVLLEEDH